MYTSSEDAIEDNAAISFEMARRELARHGMFCQQPLGAHAAGLIYVRDDYAPNALDGWDAIPCTTKGVLEWLGY